MADVIESPLIGRVLAHVTLRRELRAVYDDLFDADGAAVVLRSVDFYGVDASPVTFGDAADAVAVAGDVALGVIESGQVTLNPPRSMAWSPGDDCRLVVLGR